MIKHIVTGLFLTILLVGCSLRDSPATTIPTLQPIAFTSTPSPQPTATSTPTFTPTATETPLPTSTPTPEAYGPSNFPENINPLTGFEPSDTSLLERRPVAVKDQHCTTLVQPASMGHLIRRYRIRLLS